MSSLHKLSTIISGFGGLGLFIVAFTTSLSAFWVSFAQSSACNFDLSIASEMFSDAEAALDAGDAERALAGVRKVRTELELIEARCDDYAPETAGNSRTNPVPYGQRQNVLIPDNFTGSVEITGFVANANQLVFEDDDDNEPPDPGMRYVLVQLRLYCEASPSATCEFSSWHWYIVGSLGLSYEYVSPFRASPYTDSQEMFGGAQFDAEILYMVGEEETDFVLFNDYGTPVFFAVQDDS